MIVEIFEVIMPPIEVIRVGGMVHLCTDDGTYPVPIWVAEALGCNRELIDAVKRECLPNITRRKPEQDS
jgi:hypothetical protein